MYDLLDKKKKELDLRRPLSHEILYIINLNTI
jgi:hypothetical protein